MGKERVAVCQSSGCVIRPALTAVVPRWMRADHPQQDHDFETVNGTKSKQLFYLSKELANKCMRQSREK